MARRIKESSRNLIVTIVCIILFVTLQVIMIIGERINGLTSFNGVFMACQFALCLLLIRCNQKKGIIISSILMGVSVIMLIRAMFFGNPVALLPGLFNSLIYIFTMIMLNQQFRIREKEAVTDFLTGLTNRRGLKKLLRRKTESGKAFSLIYIDLGNFKILNDNHGHTFGDKLLQTVAGRMNEVVGKNGMVTRVGGYEFVVVIDENSNAIRTADDILDKIREKAVISTDETTVESYLSAFAGVSSFPDDSDDYEDLIKYADIAMLEAMKDKSLKTYRFDKVMESKLVRELEVEKLIKDGLVNDYFYLVYQPQYKLSGKKLRGFESLLRMKTPDGKIISPSEFIPVAEKSGLILEIDDYVLKRAMNEFKDIVKNLDNQLTISINVSAKNIGEAVFPEKVQRVLDETGFPASNLEIEITEYCLVQSVDVTIENINRLRSMNVQVALDDFGTGYTSLSYLAKMPINLLKVDKSLVDDIESSSKSRDFVHAVISMGHMMGCEVISEGVETQPQLELLTSHECDFVQGYVWGRPLEYDVAQKLVAEQN